MTPAQKSRLRVLVNRATDTRGFECLVAYVDQYATKPQAQGPLRADGTHGFPPTAQACDPARCSLWTRALRRFA